MLRAFAVGRLVAQAFAAGQLVAQAMPGEVSAVGQVTSPVPVRHMRRATLA
jgi:hypothetical protein